MKMLIVNILLFFVACSLLATVGVFGLLYGILYKIFRLQISIKAFIEYIARIIYMVNVGIDQIGNVLLATFLNNTTLINKEGAYEYGRIDQTISHVLAVNYYRSNLTAFGLWIVNVLEYLDSGHIEKSL